MRYPTNADFWATAGDEADVQRHLDRIRAAQEEYSAQCAPICRQIAKIDWPEKIIIHVSGEVEYVYSANTQDLLDRYKKILADLRVATFSRYGLDVETLSHEETQNPKSPEVF